MAKEKSKAKRKILKGYVEFLSLCPRGANTIQTVYKADDGTNKNISFAAITKDLTEQGELIACVYSPDLVDSQGDTASAKVIKQMAYDFAHSGVGIDIRHDNKAIPAEEAFVAESFIIQKGDPRFAGIKNYDGEVVDVTDGWGVVIKIEDDRLKDLYRSGAWGGISMGGLVLTEDSEKEDGALLKALKSIVEEYFTGKKSNKQNDMEINMDKKELAELLAENNKQLVAAFKEAMKPAEETTEQKTARLAKEEAEKKVTKGMGYPKPVLKENATEEEMDRFAKETDIYELSLCVDRTSVQSVREFQKMAKEIATETTGNEKTKAKDNVYGGFFKSNQDVKAKNADGSEKSVADLILAQMDKEEKEAKVA